MMKYIMSIVLIFGFCLFSSIGFQAERHDSRTFCIEAPKSWSIPHLSCIQVPTRYFYEIRSLPLICVEKVFYNNGSFTGLRRLVLLNIRSNTSVAWNVYYEEDNTVFLISRGRRSPKMLDRDGDGLFDTDHYWKQSRGELMSLTSKEVQLLMRDRDAS